MHSLVRIKHDQSGNDQLVRVLRHAVGRMADPITLPHSQNHTPSAPEEASAAVAAAGGESKKRKLEYGGLQDSIYFKIRAIVRDLRPLFMEVIRCPEFPNSKASQDIQKQMKIMIDLSKEMRHGLASSAKQAKLPVEEPSAGGSNDRNTGNLQTIETHASQPPTINIPNAPASVSEKEPQPKKIPNFPGKEPVSGRTRNVSSTAQVRTPDEKITGVKELGKQSEEGIHGTYVVGGSPIGWNYTLYPAGESVYYGVTKETARLRRDAQ